MRTKRDPLITPDILIELQAQANASDKQMATWAGVSEDTYGRWKNGRGGSPDYEQYIMICIGVFKGKISLDFVTKQITKTIKKLGGGVAKEKSAKL
ncbi:helix-turn-helix transcriptional regulator [Rheinheimera sp.]|uniref:helix-turn-helix domain-containing protein n=1 Tax=Rheinheimera sp. TaxID=1869214 RepID=UPI00307F2B69